MDDASRPGTTGTGVWSRILLLVGLLLSNACVAVRRDRGVERTRELVQQAEVQALGGDVSGAIEAVSAELTAVESTSEQDLLLRFTLGWLTALRADQEGANPVAALQEAAGWYQQVRDLAPGHLAASQNLAAIHAELAALQDDPKHFATAVRILEQALAAGPSTTEQEYGLRVDLSSLRATAGDREEALQSLDRAHALAPEEVLAPAMIIELLSDWEAGRGRLAPYCEKFARSPTTWGPAQEGYEKLVHGRGPTAPQALEHWLDLATRRGTFGPATVALLPAHRPSPAGLDLDMALAELHRLAGDPFTEELDYWTRTPERRQLIARALRVMADAGSPEAARVLYRAYAVAPSAEESLAHGLVELRLELALDLAFLYHGHADQHDPDQTRFKELFGEAGWLSLDTYHSVDRTLEQRSKYLSLLGIMFQERGVWGDEPEDLRLAAQYLRAAIDLETIPKPSLSRKLGDVLAKQGRAVQAMDAYHQAAQGFLDNGAVRLARETLPVAGPYSLDTRRTLHRQLHELEDLLYPRHGFYLGLSGGLTDGHEDGARLRSDLAAQGHSTRISINDSDFGWKVFAGYRPETELPVLGDTYQLPWAVELGYASLEGHSSRIQILATPSVSSLRSAIESEHPLTGRGLSLALQAFPWERGDLSATAKFGGWWWQSDLDVNLTGGTLRVDERGVDLLLGAGVQYRLTWRLNARAEFERYYLDGDPVDLMSLGLQWRF